VTVVVALISVIIVPVDVYRPGVELFWFNRAAFDSNICSIFSTDDFLQQCSQ